MSTAKINDGGSAFPVLEQGGDGRLELGHPGMTLRDYFAKGAMEFLIHRAKAAPKTPEEFDWVADIAYMQADAMLRRRA